MDIRKVFGERLLNLREERGETQDQLAKAVGITRQSLSRYETNERTPNIELIYNIAKHYEVSADYLLGLSDVKSLDNRVQAACEVTGLNDDSVITLSKISKDTFNDCHEDLKRDDIINACITHPMFSAVIDSIIQLIRDADSYKVSLLFEDEAKRNEIYYHWSKEFVMSKYVVDEAFKHLCDKLIEEITGLSIDDLYNETITDLRYYRRDCNGKHNPKNQ